MANISSAGRARVIFSTGSLYPLDTSQCFELAAEAGFDGMEIMCDERFSTRSAPYLRRLTERTGMPVLVVHTPFGHRYAGWPAGLTELDRIERSIQLSEELGAESLVVHLPMKLGHFTVLFRGKTLNFPWFNNPFRPVMDWMRNGGLVEWQSRTDVQIAIENMPVAGSRSYFHWSNIPTWSRIHEHLTLDTTHWATHGIDPVEAFRAANSRVKHIHLSNFDGREHRLPHKGDLDLAVFLHELRDANFTGTVCLELHPDALDFTDEAAMRRNLADSVAFTKEHLL